MFKTQMPPREKRRPSKGGPLALTPKNILGYLIGGLVVVVYPLYEQRFLADSCMAFNQQWVIIFRVFFFAEPVINMHKIFFKAIRLLVFVVFNDDV
jgi:hypothetical protein